MIDREDVAQREKRGEWRGGDDGDCGGEGIPSRAGSLSGRETKGSTPEGRVSLEAGGEGGSVNYLRTSLFPSLFTPPRVGS